MERDEYADRFRFQIGQCVRWAAYPNERHWIGKRRWTQREIMSPVVEYQLQLSQTSSSNIGWAYEADLEAWKEEALSA